MHKNTASQGWQNDLNTLLHLRCYLYTLMDQVNMTDLSASELIAIIIVLAPISRRLVCDTFKEPLRPVLRLIDVGGQTSSQFMEQGADLVDQFSSGDVTEPLGFA